MTPVRPITSRCCLSLASHAFQRAVILAVVGLLASHTFAWTIKSRELVDVEITAKGALSILVSAPGTASPGLYQWKSGIAEPTKICVINAPSFFSFNRRIVIERTQGEHDSLRLYGADNCAVLGQIVTAGRVIDADAQGDLIAVAIQYADGARTLELYTKRGKLIAKSDVGRNVELGFAPDGKTLFNFDFSDAINASWRIKSLARVSTPRWVKENEASFIPGAKYVKVYADGALSIVPWSTGKPKYTTSLARSVRVRQLSRDGRYGVVHERLSQTDSVAWIDFATGKRMQLGEGSIDHAAINANGTSVAWTQRSGLLGDEVTLLRATLSLTGSVISTNATNEGNLIPSPNQ